MGKKGQIPWEALDDDDEKPLDARMGSGPHVKGVVVDLAGLLVSKDALLQILPSIAGGRELQLRIQMRELPGPVRGGGYDLIEAVDAWFRFKVLSAAEAERGDLSSKDRYWAARAQKEEIEAEAAAGRYVPLVDMLEAWQSCFSMVANRVDAVAGRVAAELAGVADAAIIRKRLMEELRGARAEAAEQIRDWEERLTRALRDADRDDAAAAEDAGSVG